ncbi:hypothetical protein ACFB49_32460 [Sphingomonas sp. DBB INV C78]|uniref:hypothetical protein n=1 Tax=Sphingomonas sp. DBB INV C78 TaxID=3349434 RepID=UPI0036D253AD
MSGTNNLQWWSRRSALLIFVIAAALPLLWPSLPPLTDLPGHIARYKVALDLDHSPYLARYFDYHWALVGNLGVDLLAVPLARIIGLEPAVRLIVTAIPPFTVAGMLWIAREIHGRVPPTALFALPLAYAFPFQFGFVNFTLSIALMFLGVGLWLHLSDPGRARRRALIFVPISFAIFLAHSIAWGMFGLAIFAIETMTARQRGRGWLEAAWLGMLACLPLAPPLLLMADWWANRTTDAFSGNWRLSVKIGHLLSILRNSSQIFDMLSAGLLYILLWHGIRPLGLRFDPRLGLAGLLLFLAFLALPGMLMGAAYADMRLAPYAIAISILALAPVSDDPKWSRIIAIGGLLFCATRLGVQTWTYWKLDRGYQAQLAAIEHIPMGARVFAMAGAPCSSVWNAPRMDQLGQMAVVRREAFVNGQWPMPGGRLLSVTHSAAAGFAIDPTELLQPARCRQTESYSLAHVVAKLPRPAFDYLWLINVPPDARPHDPGLVPAWQGEGGALYRIRH